jgi:hypothetical protein
VRIGRGASLIGIFKNVRGRYTAGRGFIALSAVILEVQSHYHGDHLFTLVWPKEISFRIQNMGIPSQFTLNAAIPPPQFLLWSSVLFAEQKINHAFDIHCNNEPETK